MLQDFMHRRCRTAARRNRSQGPARARPQWAAQAIVWVAVAVAAALVLWALPQAIRSAVAPPSGLWSMALAAVLVDAPLARLLRRAGPQQRSTLSVCFSVAIFAAWGAAAAIVVQAAAGAVSVWGQRYRPREGLYLVARLVCAVAAAEFAAGFLDPWPITGQGTGLTITDLVTFGAMAGVFLVVDSALTAAARASTGRRDGPPPTAENYVDLVAAATSILVISPLLTAIRGWAALLIAAPLLLLNGFLREQLRGEEGLRRDPVSGLLNRQGLAAGMRALAGTDVVEPQRSFGVAVINIESILTINRTFGRELYEKLVAASSRRLVAVYGEDRIGRLSGEGIVILLPDLGETACVAEAENAVRLLAQQIEVDEIPFALEPVAGVALSPRHGQQLGTLLAKAELAADEARRTGRPAVLYVRQAAQLTRRRTTLVRDLHTALRDPSRHGEVGVLYQPQVRMDTRQLHGAEALVRWTHPQLGPIPADELIEAIELTDVMPVLTRHMLEQVGAQLSAWNAQGWALRVAVNVSVRDLHDPHFTSDVRQVVQSNAIDPGQLTIEITERMVTDGPQVAQRCRELAHLGVGLSLDDFGTGHASIQQLRRFPLTEVKIDRSFVAALAMSPVDRTFVTGVHSFARAMGADVVAEGIEDARTATTLTALEGVIGQGYYFGRPTSAAELHRRRDATWP